MSDIELQNLKQYLQQTGFLNEKELNTISRIAISTKCTWCNTISRCGRTSCCSQLLCTSCLDDLYDTCDDKQLMFRCPQCQSDCTEINYL